MFSARTWILPSILVVVSACASGSEGTTSFSTTTFGTTLPESGDGDPETSESGDGDGDPTGDGDGDPETSGDGDGDPTGDGDGDASGDGDGDAPMPDMPAEGPLGVNDLMPGELVITEIMYNPQACDDVRCEWIEVLNQSETEVDLLGLRVQDINMDETGTVDVQLVLADGEYAWIGKGPMANWGYPDPADAYIGTSPAFNNSGDDQVLILNDTEVIDAAAPYTASDAGVGVSWQLQADQLDAVANDNPASWCYSTQVFNGGDYGTPKAVNDPCF